MPERKISLSLIIFLILIVKEKSEKNSPLKCGNPSKIIPKGINPIPNKNKSQPRRHLEFKDFKIVLETKNIETEIKLYNLTKYQYIILNSITESLKYIQSLFKVRKLECYTFKENFVEEFGFHYWDKEKFGISGSKRNFSNCDYDIDLLIFTRFFNDTEMKNGEYDISSEPLYIDSSTGQPIVGSAVFNRNIDFSKNNTKNYLEFLFFHIFTHILGFDGFIMNKYFHNIYTTIDLEGVRRSYINSTKVVNVAKKYFNCSTIKGVEIEGSIDSKKEIHWKGRILLGEYMAPIYTEEHAISELTLSLLEDTGYYQINYYTGGLMRYGKDKGCKFLEEKCIQNSKTDQNFENEFFDTIYSNSNYDTSCSSGRQSRTYFYLHQYKESIPFYYNYFLQEKIGGLNNADYCPVSTTYLPEESNSFYSGRCSNLGNGEYGTKILYLENKKNTYYKSKDIKNITGETFSERSFCYQSSLIKEKEPKFDIYSKVVRAVCYETFCSSESLTVKIHENYIVCPRAGGKIEVAGYGGYFMCPDYNLICTGTVLCNDIFDCIKKKSREKYNTYSYNYNIKTTQNIGRFKEENSDNENNYELSNDGICLKNCSVCTKNEKCIKCRNKYGLLANFRNETDLTCVPETNLINGYYKNNSKYYQCSSNCKICSNYSVCNECGYNYVLYGERSNSDIVCIYKDSIKTGYYSINNIYYKCSYQCEICVNDTYCEKCASSYHLIDWYNNGVISCRYKYGNYYYIGSYSSYNYPIYYDCGVDYCSECLSMNNCKKCNENYVFFKNNTNVICLYKDEVETGYYMGYNSIYYKCTDHCKKCSYSFDCSECQEDYSLVGDNEYEYYRECLSKNELDIGYYQGDNLLFYKCREHCNKCTNSYNCEECERNYSLVGNKEDDDYFECLSQEEIDIGYYKDVNSIFYKCIDHCNKCNNSYSCHECQMNYSFVGNTENNSLICLSKEEVMEGYYQTNNSIYYKCMDYCDKCLSNKICNECQYNYLLVGNKENDEIICLHEDEILSGYYEAENSIYYKCMENCKECSSFNSCDKCEDYYNLVGNHENDQLTCLYDNVLTSGYYEIYNYNLGYSIFYKCLDNCDICSDYLTCEECQWNYSFVGNKENEYLKCLSWDELQKGYYLDNEIYYECLKYCEICQNDTYCQKCRDNFDYDNNTDLCVGRIDNCDEYYLNGSCKKCLENYYILEYDKDNCIKKQSLINLYTKDSGISYFYCDGEGNEHIKNCNKCNYNEENTNKLTCKECNEDFVILDNETNKCYSKKELNNSKYFTINETHIKTCSKEIDYCSECISNEKCIKCDKDYYFINDNQKKCINLNEIEEIDGYFLDNNNSTYYSCNNSKYNSFQNCKKCSKKNSCSLCNVGYTFINGNKSNCVQIKSLENKYYQDPKDITNYEKCSKIDINCLNCSNYNTCLSCSKGFGLYNTKDKCINISDEQLYQNESDKLYYYCENSIEGCKKCSSKDICIDCDEEVYTLIDKKCIKVEINKFIKDANSTKYIPCSKAIDNCELCSSRNNCIKCLSNFTKINGINNTCHSISELGNDFYLDPLDKTNYIKCSQKVNNCSICNSSQCLLCEDGYIFTNNNFNKCLLKSSINLSNYFTEDNITYFSCEDGKYKSNPKCIIKTDEILTTELFTEDEFTEKEDDSKELNIYNFTIAILQAKIESNNLLLYIYFDSKIPENIFAYVTLSVSKKRLLRYLEEKEIIIKAVPNADNDNQIYEFSSDLKDYNINEGDNIQIKDIKLEENGGKNNYYVAYPNDLDSINKGIYTNENEEIDFSEISKKKDYNIKIYKVESITKGCDFNIRIDQKISTKNYNYNFSLIFEEINNNKNSINANCTLSSKNNNEITCHLNKEVNNAYYLKDYIYYDNNELYTIIPNNKSSFYSLFCKENNTNNNIKGEDKTDNINNQNNTTNENDTDITDNTNNTNISYNYIPKKDSESGPSIGLIIGIIAGAVVFIAIMTIIVVCLVKKKCYKPSEPISNDSSHDNTESPVIANNYGGNGVSSKMYDSDKNVNFRNNNNYINNINHIISNNDYLNDIVYIDFEVRGRNTEKIQFNKNKTVKDLIDTYLKNHGLNFVEHSNLMFVNKANGEMIDQDNYNKCIWQIFPQGYPYQITVTDNKNLIK